MKTKFIYVVLAVLFLGSLLPASAQDAGAKPKKQRFTPEQMVQFQTNQMVKALLLDDATAAKFTPMYEKYLNEIRECRMMNHKFRLGQNGAREAGVKAAKDAPKPVMTDAEIAKMLKDQFAQSRKMLDVREKYYNEFSKILSQKQILKIYKQERGYMNKFRKEFDRRKKMRKGHGQQFKQGNHWMGKNVPQAPQK